MTEQLKRSELDAMKKELNELREWKKRNELVNEMVNIEIEPLIVEKPKHEIIKEEIKPKRKIDESDDNDEWDEW